MRLFSLWLGLLSLILHTPAHAVGKELVVGVQPYQPTRVHADMTPDKRVRAQLQRALLDYPTPRGSGMVTANEQDLASMDNHLEHARRLLQASALPSQSSQRAPR